MEATGLPHVRARSAAAPVVRSFQVVHYPGPLRLAQPRSDVWTCALLLTLSVVLLFSRLPCGLLEPDEARHAEIARQMLAEGRWHLPVLHGEDYLHKPPLLYWLVMLSFSVCGVCDWAARLMPCLAGVATVLVAYLWARQTLGRRAAFAGSLLLLLSGRFLYLQSMLLFDSLLCFFVTLALATGHLALTRAPFSRRLWHVSAVATGLAVMTKGPVALLLVCLPLAGLWLARPVATRPHAWRLTACYSLITSAIAGPWFLWLAWHRPDAFANLFWIHHVQRFWDSIDHVEPWWFFLPGLALAFLPWLLFLGLRGSQLLSNRRGRFFLSAGVWCVVFFSLAACKRSAYILPALPPLALAFGLALSRSRWFIRRDRSRAVVLTRRGWLLVAGLVLTFELAALVWLPRYHERFGMRDVLEATRMPTDAPVLCFPRHWDSVSFYCAGREVATASDVTELWSEVNKHGSAWLVLRRRDGWPQVCAACPPGVDLHVQPDRHDNVVVVLAVRR